MNSPIFTASSALNIEIPGTAGSFSISRKGQASKAVEVQYLLTHVALGATGSQSHLLDMLAPVREVFDIDQLDFNEIMQRDIDDARVSMDLIPYLLDHSNSGFVKLFPPIVVVVLPLKDTSRRPDHRYAKVSVEVETDPSHAGYSWKRTTAGPRGKEQFELSQLIRPDGSVDPPHSKLKLAQSNCALAIVDGQHRAMALLALYRNLKSGWSDARRAIYQQYYRVWSEDEIRKFETSDLQMPMIICTFPQLDVDYQGDMDVIRAARRVFLDLNKNAKKVSDSRNKLLDDQNIVSECLRAVLANVKAYDVNSPTPLRIANVELDQAQDRSVISSPVALTGVSHLYYIAEHLLFYSSPIKDIHARRANMARASKLNEAYTRLGLANDLTWVEQCDNTKKNYTDKIAKAIVARWKERYGDPLELILAKFHPFAAHARASLQVKEKLRAANNMKLQSLLFDGQASSRTFEDFRDRLDLKNSSEAGWGTPELLAIAVEVKAQIGEYDREVEFLKMRRAADFVSEVRGPHSRLVKTGADDISPVALKICNQLYQHVFTSIAFQAATILTLVEAYERRYDASADEAHQITPDEVLAYIADLEVLFKPTSWQKFASLSEAFFTQLRVADDVIQEVPTSANFSALIIAGEMKPDEWPKYRYVILELWHPQDAKLREIVEDDRDLCRASVLRAAYRRGLINFCAEQQTVEQNVSVDDKRAVLATVVNNFEQFLKNICGREVNLTGMVNELEGQLGFMGPEEVEQEDSQVT